MLKYQNPPLNLLTDQLRCPKRIYSAPRRVYWPRDTSTRMDTPIMYMLHGSDVCYWKDVYITPNNPTALIGTTPLHRLKPFYMICSIFKVAKIKPKYRYQLSYMLNHQDARDAVNLIMNKNKSWAVKTWHPRCKKDAFQLIRNSNGIWRITPILLYREPLFVPRKNLNAIARFSDGTEPSTIEEGPNTTFTNLNINVGEH